MGPVYPYQSGGELDVSQVPDRGGELIGTARRASPVRRCYTVT
jgi:hypothetical protein